MRCFTLIAISLMLCATAQAKGHAGHGHGGSAHGSGAVHAVSGANRGATAARASGSSCLLRDERNQCARRDDISGAVREPRASYTPPRFEEGGATFSGP